MARKSKKSRDIQALLVTTPTVALLLEPAPPAETGAKAAWVTVSGDDDGGLCVYHRRGRRPTPAILVSNGGRWAKIIDLDRSSLVNGRLDLVMRTVAASSIRQAKGADVETTIEEIRTGRPHA